MLDDMNMENKIKDMPDRNLMEFTARQVWETRQILVEHEKRIAAIEGRDRRGYGLAGFAGATIVAIGYFVQLWIKK